MHSPSRPSLSGLRRLQRGVSLLFSLMALVVLSLGAVALLRSVDTGLLVLGNLGLKQDALAAGSAGTEAAITWLQVNGGVTLEADQRGQGYSAVAITAMDPTGRSVATAATSLVLVDWASNGCAVSGIGGRPLVCVPASPEIAVRGGNKVRYVITRLCAAAGPPDATNDCVAPLVTDVSGTSNERGSLSYSSAYRTSLTSLGTYYRIVTRTEGVRGTVSYTETLVHF